MSVQLILLTVCTPYKAALKGLHRLYTIKPQSMCHEIPGRSGMAGFLGAGIDYYIDAETRTEAIKAVLMIYGWTAHPDCPRFWFKCRQSGKN
jgi:hypothetical protein